MLDVLLPLDSRFWSGNDDQRVFFLVVVVMLVVEIVFLFLGKTFDYDNDNRYARSTDDDNEESGVAGGQLNHPLRSTSIFSLVCVAALNPNWSISWASCCGLP